MADLRADRTATTGDDDGLALHQRFEPRMVDLLEGIGARTDMPKPWHAEVDEVRRRRNALVHEEAEEVAVVSLAEARTRLCRFFSRLPPDW